MMMVVSVAGLSHHLLHLRQELFIIHKHMIWQYGNMAMNEWMNEWMMNLDKNQFLYFSVVDQHRIKCVEEKQRNDIIDGSNRSRIKILQNSVIKPVFICCTLSSLLLLLLWHHCVHHLKWTKCECEKNILNSRIYAPLFIFMMMIIIIIIIKVCACVNRKNSYQAPPFYF